jgi:hypothetical protein
MVVIVERDALGVALAFRWLTAAPSAAAVKAGHRATAGGGA